MGSNTRNGTNIAQTWFRPHTFVAHQTVSSTELDETLEALAEEDATFDSSQR